jgi:hypothetical protein
MLLMLNPQAPTALKNEIPIVNLGGQMLSAASIAKTHLMVRHSTALTENQRPFFEVMVFIAALGT